MAFQRPLPTPRWRRRVARLLIVFAVLGGGLTGGLLWLGGSDSGLRVLCSALAAISGDRLQISGASGRLWDDWHAQSLRWRDAQREIEVQQLALVWSPGALLHGELALARLEAASLRVYFAPDSAPAALPDNLQLPLAVTVAQLRIGQLLYGESGGPMMLADQIDAALVSDGGMHRLEHLRARQGLLGLSAEATLDGQRPFAVTAHAALSGAAVGQPFALDLQGRGPLDHLQVDGTVGAGAKIAGKTSERRAAASGQLKALVTLFEPQPLAELRLQISAIDPALLFASAPPAQLDVDVQLERAERAVPGQTSLKGSLRIVNRASGTLDRQRLPLESLRAQLVLDTHGLAFDPLEIALVGGGALKGQGRLAGAQLELDLVARQIDVHALHGGLLPTRLGGPLRAHLGGDRQHFEIDWRDARFALNARANVSAQAFEIERLQLASGDASLSVQGKLALEGDGRFSAHGRLHHFDPARFLQPAAISIPRTLLNASVEATGALRPMLEIGLRFDLQDSRLGGQALAGKGRFDLSGSRLHQMAIDLDAAGNRLRADGAFGRPGDTVHLTLAAPRLESLGWSALSGDVQASLAIGGSLATPEFSGQLQAARLHLAPWVEVKDLTLTAQLAAGAQGMLSGLLRCAACALPAAGVPPLSLEAKAEGVRSAHQLNLRVGLPDEGKVRRELRLALAGGLLTESSHKTGPALQWRGTLAELRVARRGEQREVTGAVTNPAAEAVPLLELTAPAPLQVGATSFSFGPATISGPLGSLRIERLVHEAGRWQSAGSLRHLRPQQVLIEFPSLAAWRATLGTINPQPLVLAGEWEMALGEQAVGRAALWRESGDLLFGTLPLGLAEARLQASLGDGRVTASAQLRGQRLGTLSADFSAVGGRAAKGEASPLIDAQAPWQGRLQADVPDLSWLGPLLGEGWQVAGQLHGTMALAGSAARPQFSGQWRGEQLALRALDQGMRLERGEALLDLSADRLLLRKLSFESDFAPLPRVLRLDPHIDAVRLTGKPGRFTASGELPLGGASGALLALHLDRLGVAQGSDQWLAVSGDGDIRLGEKVLEIRGDLSVDAGFWSLAPAGRPSLSDDVVLYRANAVPAASRVERALKLDLGVALGSSVHFLGAGVESLLAGKLRIRSDDAGLPRATGSISTVDGRFDAYGQKLEIERGIVNFQGAIDNPGLNLLAVRKNLQVEAGVEVTGTAQHPQIRLVSTPTVPDAEKLSWLVLGRSPEQRGGDSSVLLAAAQTIFGGQDGGVVGQLQRALGVDEFGVSSGQVGGVNNLPTSRVASSTGFGGSSQTVNSQIVSVGKRLSSNALLSYEQSLNTTESIVKLTVTLNRQFSVVGRAGSESALDFFWHYSFGR